MWEFCINISNKNINTSKKLYHSLKDFCTNWGGVVTTYERCDNISIIVACDECDENRYKHFLTNLTYAPVPQ